MMVDWLKHIKFRTCQTGRVDLQTICILSVLNTTHFYMLAFQNTSLNHTD
ncbi:hypothetical protein HanRHA438_Chr02g0060481 [Helianthus annuus]|nr:hypothetical protein HanRHA438_Chr02g0060481 [Helianthus annuus]